MKDPHVTDEEKRKLSLSLEVKDFSVKRLHLKDSKNYTSFVKLNRPSVTYVVNASSRWELKHFEWSFPFVGKMPYKGFFSEQEALEEEAELKTKNLDTYLRGVSAYSTLGWFNGNFLVSPTISQENNQNNTCHKAEKEGTNKRIT
jgi:predicted aminopeptidase